MKTSRTPNLPAAALGGAWRSLAIDDAPNSSKMERMKIIPRIIESRLRQALARQKSVLLLGPRQTGKTTLVEALKPDLLLNFLRP